MSETPETPVEHDAIEENPAAPARPDEPVTVTAPWHNAPGTGAYTEPEVTTVRAYDKQDDGTLVAKVLEPPARPRPARGRRASSTQAAPAETQTETAEDGDDPAETA